jgi:peptide-methionine (S)-S-oxide reductase
MKSTNATFAAGCFWGVEAKFRTLKGVISTRVGYTGGTVKDPDYRLVCTDTTGHAEAVQITYDEKVISYKDLLDLFWKIHDPTSFNRQGLDYGSQYRSVIFYHNEKQKKLAENQKQLLQNSGQFKSKIVTEILPATTFYIAEEYHQQYYEKHGLHLT